MSQTRTRNSILNFSITFIAGVLLPVFGLVKYSLFMGHYGTEINGVQITMESVIAVLNIFEICFSLAFRQLLFKPLAEDNKNEVNLIYSYGLRIFRLTGIVFLILGFAIALAFPFFNESPFVFLETVIYFIILVIPYGISYFLMGPNLVLIADQQEYKINIWIQAIAILRMILMIIAIVIKLPVVWIFVIESAQILVANLLSRRIALNLYPWLKKVKVNDTDGYHKDLVNNIKYTFVQRMEVISTSNVDTFAISVFLSYTSASIYGAYNYIVDNISKIINKALETTLNSFGNLFSKENDAYDVFLEFFEFVSFVATLVSVCVCLFFNDFLSIWLRDVDVTFSAGLSVVIVLSFNIFYMILRESYIIGRDATGLFKKASGNAILFIATKLVTSLLLINLYGINGAIISTALVNVLIDLPFNPKLLCDNVFKSHTLDFYKRITGRTVLTVVIGIGLYFVKDILFGNWTLSYLHFFISAASIGILAFIISFVMYYIFYKPFRLFIKRVFRSLGLVR